MLLKDLAKEFNLEEDVLLSTLKALKLRAKGEAQELSPAVLMVLKGELESKGLIPKQEPEKKPVKKPAAKKAPAKKPAVKKADEGEPAVKKTSVKKTVKKVASKSEEESVSPASSEEQVPSVPSVEVPVSPKVVAVPPPVAKGESKHPLPNELAQFEHPESAKPADAAAGATQKRFVKKIVTKIVTRKKSQADAPEFISVQPLQKRRPGGRTDRSPDGKRHEDKRGHEAEELQAAQSAQPKFEGPLQDIEIKLPIGVGDLAFRIQQKVNVVLKSLIGMGVFANINQSLGADIVRKICEEYGFNLIEGKTQEEQAIAEHEEEKDDPALLQQRAPVITFMGHVDHGKTSLLDAIRKTKVVDTEHGGITQHIRAYSVRMPKGLITFLDTPGHAAFTAMRARGAHVTDIVVLVIAAGEGIMPQTEEAIDHARAAGVPLVVALNKMDRPDADPERVKKQLAERDLLPEEWGGKTIVVPVSAVTGQGIDNLLEMILLEAEMLELKANPNKKASGIVVEAHLSPGKGALATMIVQAGTLNEGDVIVTGPYYGRVKALFDDHQRHVKSAGPSTPVEILGLSAVPEAGEKFFVVENEKVAREIALVREQRLKEERLKASSKITLEDLFARKEKGEIQSLNLVLKADVQGSVEALKTSLEKVPSESKEVDVKFIHCGVGDVNPSDVILAHASKAIIIAFNVGVNSNAQDELEKTPVDVRRYNVIYNAVNDVKAALEGMLKPETKRNFIARAEVRQVFKLSKSGIVAGCYVLKGKFRNRLDVDLIRNGEPVFTGKITTLKRFKDDVKEVNEGFECGISLENYTDYQAGDVIEAFELQHIARTL